MILFIHMQLPFKNKSAESNLGRGPRRCESLSRGGLVTTAKVVSGRRRVYYAAPACTEFALETFSALEALCNCAIYRFYLLTYVLTLAVLTQTASARDRQTDGQNYRPVYISASTALCGKSHRRLRSDAQNS